MKVGDLIQVDDGRHALFNGHIGIVTGKHHFAIGDPGDDYIYDVLKGEHDIELSVEQMQFAENTMKYQTTLKFLNGKITKMISAIRGE